MDWGAIAGNVPFIAIVVGLILLQVYLMRRMRRRKPAASSWETAAHREIVRCLLFDVRLNSDLTEVFRLHWQARKFETFSWRRSKTKVDFLAQPVRAALTDAVVMAEDFNQQIAAAKKYKSVSYMDNIDVNKLKEPLARSRQGLEEWLQANGGIKEPPPQYPSIIDMLFGRQRF